MNRLKILLLIFSGLLLLSCTEDVARDLFGEWTPVEISAKVKSQESELTRAATNLNTDAGFTLSSTDAYNKVCVNIDGDEYVYSITAEEGETVGTSLERDGTKPYFPIGETSVSVSARYPDYEDDITTSGSTTYFTIQQDQTTQDAYLRSDLMTATATATRTLQSNGTWSVTEAELEFQHQMAKLVMNVSTEDENIMKVKKVVVNSVKPRVPLTGNSYTVGEATTVGDDTYDVVAVDEDEGQSSCESAVIIPAQTFLGTFVTVTVDFKDPYGNGEWEDYDLTYAFSGTGKTLLANTVYTMNIVVGIDNIVLHDGTKTNNKVDISEWNDANSTTINIFPTVVHTSLRMEGSIELHITTPKVYTGHSITLSTSELVVKNGEGATLVIDQDYVATYENNLEAGTATVTVVGFRQYSGTLSATFPIGKRSFDNVTIADISPETYDGFVHRPAVSITEEVEGELKTLFLDTDFTLTYPEDLTTAGTKTITITPINNYAGDAQTKTFVIEKAVGEFTLADNSVRFYVPTNRTQTYTNQVTIIRGDEDVTITGTPNSGTVRVGSGGVVTMAPTSNGNTTQTVTINVTSQNYTYASKTFSLNMKSGPILPIWYVAPTNVGALDGSGNHALAENNWTSFSAYYSWNQEVFGKYNTYSLKKNGITKDGVHYHFPSYYEWLSIVGDGISWSTTASTNNSDADVKFGVTTSKTSQSDDTDYTYHSPSTSSWKSDYKMVQNADGSVTYYGHRFKGTEYCCAYRYDRILTDNSNASLTGNSYGSVSLVIRVIYLGLSSSTNINNIQSLDWANGADFIVSLPQCSLQQFGDDPGTLFYSDLLHYGWHGRYYSSTKYSSDYYRYLYVDQNGAMSYTPTGGSYALTYGYSIRLFRDY